MSGEMMYVLGLCMGVFIGTVVMGVASFVDNKRFVKQERERIFKEIGEVIFIDEEVRNNGRV